MGSYQKAPQKGITELQYLLRGSFVLFLFQLTIKLISSIFLEVGSYYSRINTLYLFAHNRRELFYENLLNMSSEDYTTSCTVFGSFYYNIFLESKAFYSNFNPL